VTVSITAPPRAATALPPGLVRYVAVRLAAAVGVLLAVSVVVFLFVHAAPGGPEYAMAGPMATPDQLAAIRLKYHLDAPLTQQYVNYLGDLLHGDLGDSFTRKTSVTVALREAAGITVPLMVVTWALSLVLGVALGIVTASRAGGWFDRLVVSATTVGASSPAFAVGTLLAWLFGIKLGWLPVQGGGSGADTLAHLILPAITASVMLLAATTRFTRLRVGQILGEDQMVFARSRGLSRGWVLRNVVLRNAGVQLITLSGSLLVSLIAGLIIVEQVFNLPGLGTLMVESIHERDIAVVQGVALFASLLVVGVNLFTDLVCFVVDPRLRASLTRGRR